MLLLIMHLKFDLVVLVKRLVALLRELQLFFACFACFLASLWATSLFVIVFCFEKFSCSFRKKKKILSFLLLRKKKKIVEHVGLSIAILKYNKYTNSNEKRVTKLNWTFFFWEKKRRKSKLRQQAKIEGNVPLRFYALFKGYWEKEKNYLYIKFFFTSLIYLGNTFAHPDLNLAHPDHILALPKIKQQHKLAHPKTKQHRS